MITLIHCIIGGIIAYFIGVVFVVFIRPTIETLWDKFLNLFS